MMNRCREYPTVPIVSISTFLFLVFLLVRPIPRITWSPTEVPVDSRRAFVYFMGDVDRSDLLLSSMHSLHEGFNRRKNYPIVVLSARPERYALIRDQYPGSMFLEKLDMKEWDVDPGPGVPSYIWVDTAFFDVQYRRMGRYTSHPMWQHPALDSVEIAIKLDPDVTLPEAWDNDPFDTMGLGGAIGYVRAEIDTPLVTEGLAQLVGEFNRSHTLLHPDWLFGVDGTYRNAHFQGSFMAVRISRMREPLHAELFRAMDAERGWFLRRWDEQSFMMVYAAFAFNETEVVFLGDVVPVLHKNRPSSPWRLGPRLPGVP